MRSITLACLLAFGCVHIPAGPAGDRLRAIRIAAIANAVGGAVIGGTGGGLAAAGIYASSCRGWSCTDVPFVEVAMGWGMVAFGALHLFAGGLLAAQLLVTPEPPR